MNDAKSNADIERLCLLPGPQGVLWRLIREWNPDAISKWMEGERIRGTDVMLMAHAIGAMFGTVSFVFGINAQKMHGVSPQRAVEEGIIPSFQRDLQFKVDQARMSVGGIIDPTARVGDGR